MSQGEQEPAKGGEQAEDLDYVLGEVPPFGDRILVSADTVKPGIPVGRDLDEEITNFTTKQTERYEALLKHVKDTGGDIVIIARGHGSALLIGVGAATTVGIVGAKLARTLYQHRQEHKK